jgi:hypothetical protein
MFEYRTLKDDMLTINPRMITAIRTRDDKSCYIHTVDSPDPFVVIETYEKVRYDFNTFMYSIQTSASVR